MMQIQPSCRIEEPGSFVDLEEIISALAFVDDGRLAIEATDRVVRHRHHSELLSVAVEPRQGVQVMALSTIGEMRELLVESIADVLGLDGDEVTIRTEIFDGLEQAKLSVVQPLLCYLTRVLADEAIHERLKPGGATSGNLALNLFDLVREELVSLDLVGGGAGRSGGLEGRLAATDIPEVGIITEISALIAGVDFRHSNVSLLLLYVTVYDRPWQEPGHKSLYNTTI